MSWNSFTDRLLQSGHVEKAAIFGFDGNIWHQTDGLNLHPTEVKAILGGFGEKSSLAPTGIQAGGTKYYYIQSDDGQIQGKKGPAGISIAKSGTCVIVGLYNDSMQAGNARKAVQEVVDYLIQMSY